MYRFGPFRFDPETGSLRRGSEGVALPPRAQALLGYLLERPGQVVAKDEVLDAVWGDVHVTDTSLKEAVHVLRAALGDTANSATYVETVPRRGYRFIQPVRQEPRSAAHASASASSSGRRTGWWATASVIVLTTVMLAVFAFRRPAPEIPSVPHRFEIQLPEDDAVTPGPPNLALSPDGSHLAYVAKSGGQRRLLLRPVSRLETSAVGGSEGASAPFFSPDGRWVGFFTADGLHRVAVDGGEIETLCEIKNGLAASWGKQGIVMSLLDSRDNTGLWSLPASGGRPRVLTTRQPGEAAHRWPEVLPGGTAVLFTVWRTGFEDAETALLDLETGERSTLLDGSHARLAAPGHLVFLRDDQLWTVAFDNRSRVLTGDPVPVLTDVATTPVFGTAHFAVAATGSLVFMPRREAPTPALRRLREGEEEARLEIDVEGSVHDLRLAPDGRRLAITVQRERELDLWIVDLERGSRNRRTFDGASLGPVWSPDGRWLLAASTHSGAAQILRLAADERDGGEALWTGETPSIATSWSPDGRLVAVSLLSPDHGWDLWTIEPGAVAEPWLTTPYNESRAAFSPDGRFLAYESDETGRKEVYLRSISGAGPQHAVSVDGGSHPLWAPDGRQIWFRHDAEVYSVEVRLEPAIEVGQPVPRLTGSDVPGYSVALTDDGVWILEPGSDSASTLTFLVNWLPR